MTEHAPVHREDLARDLGPMRKRLMTLALAAAALGLAAAIGQAALAGGTSGGYRRFMLAYLAAFAFVLSLSIGGLFFVLIQHLTRAGWSVLVRRPAEILAANMAVVALLFVPIAVSVVRGHGEIYPWARPESAAVRAQHHPAPLVPLEVAAAQPSPATQAGEHADEAGHGPPAGAPGVKEPPHPAVGGHAGAAGPEAGAAAHPAYPHQQLDELTLKKRPYLNVGFFLARWAVFLAVWAGLGGFYLRQSLRQDRTGDPAHSRRLESLAAPALLLFALTVTFASFDLLMSLNPHWYSTIFGVYFFTGSVVASLAALILCLLVLQRTGRLSSAVGVEHRHDLGKLLFAFVFFWGYIAYSQYMLLWYASLPETTGWLAMRGASTAHPNDWSYLLIALALGHFVIPFVGLMSRHVKRRLALLTFWAAWMLVMHWLDLVWLVMPELGPTLRIGAIEIGLVVGLTGIHLAGALWLAGRHALVPHRDPRLEESIRFENI